MLLIYLVGGKDLIRIFLFGSLLGLKGKICFLIILMAFCGGDFCLFFSCLFSILSCGFYRDHHDHHHHQHYPVSLVQCLYIYTRTFCFTLFVQNKYFSLEKYCDRHNYHLNLTLSVYLGWYSFVLIFVSVCPIE